MKCGERIMNIFCKSPVKPSDDSLGAPPVKPSDDSLGAPPVKPSDDSLGAPPVKPSDDSLGAPPVKPPDDSLGAPPVKPSDDSLGAPPVKPPDDSLDKENKIMCWADGYAHKEHIQNSLLIMLALGIIIGGASKELINPFIVCIVDVIKANTTLQMGLTVFGIFVIVILAAIAAVILSNVIGNVIGSVTSAVFGVFLGSVTVDISIGVIIGAIDDGTYEQSLFGVGLLAVLIFTINIMSKVYSRGRLNYSDERVVTDELYKVKCQQWRIFRGLKSNKEKSRLFRWHQQWRIFWGLKNECYIDHIIVCNKGVFCVETKTLYKKPQTNNEIVFDGNEIYIDKKTKNLLKQKQIQQVCDNASWLCGEIENHCKELEEKKLTSVIPIITFPGSTVQGGEKGEPNETIVVCNHKQILKRVNCRDDIEFDKKEINKICEFLENATQTNLCGPK